MTTLGRHPDALAVKLTLGDGAHLVASTVNGWAGPVTLHYGPKTGDPVISDAGTVDGDEVSWTLTEAEVTARAEHDWARLEDNGVTIAAGPVMTWLGGSGHTTTQTIASLTAGPPGPTAVSTDADNVATLGTDGRIYVPPSSASAEGIQDVVGAMIVAAGGTYDDEAGTITLPSSGGGDTTVQIGTVTLPASPTEGLSVSVLADSTTVLPEGVTWDSGGEPTITERMLLVFVWSGDDWVGTYGPSIPDVPVVPDTTGPTAGTLGVVVGVTSADGTVTGAEDETELDPAPYSFRIDAGTWSAYQAGATYEWTGLDPATEYDFQHRVRDAAGNVTEGTVVTDTTDADTTAPTAGTLGVVPGVTTADLTVTGASDDIALHATPYAYSTDNGSTWSAYQAGATYEATGLTADTEYTFRHKVRDAAGNETLGTAVVDSTDPEPADTTPPTPGTLAASAITSSGFTLTVTGASDDEALHAQPYRFSTDDGATYSAWQAGATFDATGLDPETEYTCIHQVRDAALNVATGASIPVTTEAAPAGFAVTYTDSALLGTSITSSPHVYTYTAMDIGTPSASRTVVVGIVGRGGNDKALTSVTIGGVTATVDWVLPSPTTGGNDMGFAYATVPTGTTADVVITYTSSNPSGFPTTRSAIAVWFTNSAVTLVDTEYATTSDSITATAADQVLLAVGHRFNTGGITWTGVTEEFELFDASFTFGGGSKVTSGSGAQAVSYETTATNSGLALALIEAA